jgi:hypothetical protein
VESHVGLRLARWQRLYSSFGYLRGIPDLDAAAPDLQARLRRIAHLPRGLVYAVHAGLYAGTRLVDRCAGTSSAAYGWALWFDRSAGTPVEDPPFVNVCIHLRRRTCARRFRAPLSGLVVRFLRAAQSILVRAVNQATMRFPYAPLFLFSRARRVVVRGG